MKKLLLIDFDYTLFDTTKYWQDFSRALARASGQPESTYINAYEQFVSGEGKLRLIDYEKLLQHAKVTHEAVAEELAKVARNTDYLYEDARQLLIAAQALPEYEMQILTFGEERFQNLKLGLVPQVSKYRHNIIQELKTNYIAATFPGRQGVLIDDKPDQLLPVGWTEVHINRKAIAAHEPRRVSESVWQTSSLIDVVALLQSGSIAKL